MVNSEELIVTTEYLTLYARCRLNRCRYNRVQLYVRLFLFWVHITVYKDES